MQYIKHFPVWHHPARLWISFDQPLCYKCSLCLVAAIVPWRHVKVIQTADDRMAWILELAAPTPAAHSHFPVSFTGLLLAPTCSWKKAASSTTQNYPPSTDGSSWSFFFRQCWVIHRGIVSRSDMYNSLHESRAQAAELEETEIKPYGFPTILFPRLLPISMALSP